MDLRSLEIKISRSENLPVLPQIVSQIIKISDDPNSSPKAMEAIIERDPAIAGKILRVASSSYYGVSNVTSIQRALAVLGINTVRSLVVSIAYQQMISGRAQSSLFDKVAFWKHNLATATAARIIAKMRMPFRAEEIYGAAMMHDVGLLVMDRFYPAELDRAIKYAQENGTLLHEAEEGLFGFNHAKVGGLLADRWGIEGAMKSAIQYHHDPYGDPDNIEVVCFVSAANALAHQCGFSSTVGRGCYQMPEVAFEALNMPEEQLDVIRTVIAAEISKAQEAYKIL